MFIIFIGIVINVVIIMLIKIVLWIFVIIKIVVKINLIIVKIMVGLLKFFKVGMIFELFIILFWGFVCIVKFSKLVFFNFI